MGYSFDFDGRYSRNLTINPTPPITELNCLLIELQQQKRYLEDLEMTQDRLIYKNAMYRLRKTLQDDANEIHESRIDQVIDEDMQDAQDQVCFKAMRSYHSLLDQHRELIKKFDELQLQKAQIDSQLKAAYAQNVGLQANNQQLKLQLLRPDKPLTQHLMRGHLIDLLHQFNYKSSHNLFSSNKNDETIDNLKILSKSKEDLIKIQDVLKCITDTNLRKVFNDPYVYSNTSFLSRSEFIIRELALLFRNPQITSKLSNQ